MARKLTRRTLLSGCGTILAAAPFLARIPSVHAEEVPTRFIAFMTSNDNMPRAVWDPGVGSGERLPATLPNYLGALDGITDKVVMLSDMVSDKDAGGTHENWSITLTGQDAVGGGSERFGGNKSVDQIIAERHGQLPVVLGWRTSGHFKPLRQWCSWAGARIPNVPQPDPSQAFRDIFGDVTPSASSRNATRRRRSVLDFVATELRQTTPRLPAADRFVLEAHLDGIRDLERRIAEVADVSCASAEAPEGGWDPTSSAEFPRMVRLATDVAVMAIRCDLRRSFVLQYGTASGDSIRPAWPSEGLELRGRLHAVAHHWYGPGQNEDANEAQLQRWKDERIALERWQMGLYRELLDALDAIPEPGGTALDNSVVLWTRGMGRGHGQQERFWLIGGGGSGRLSTGRYHRANGSRRDNDVLITCAHAAGFSDIDVVGDPSLCEGPLPVLR